MDIQEIKTALKACPIFEGFSDEELGSLAEVGQLRTCAAGEDLIKEGEAGDAAYIVVSGSGDVLKAGKDSGKQHNLDTVESGQILGEIGLLLEHSRSATIRAKETLSAFEITRAAFSALLDERSPSATKLMTAIARNIASRSRDINERLVDLLEHPEEAMPKRVDLSGLKGRLRGRHSYI